MSPLPLLLLVAVQQLPEPFHTAWTRVIPSVVERPETAELHVPEGFEVEVLAEGLTGPRRMALAPNGDVFVVESRAGRVTVLRDADGNGSIDRRTTFASDLARPFGIAFTPEHLYVANNRSRGSLSVPRGTTRGTRSARARDHPDA